MFSGEEKSSIPILRYTSSFLLFLSVACLIFWYPSSPDTLLIHQKHDQLKHHPPPNVTQFRYRNDNNNINDNNKYDDVPTSCHQRVSVYVYTLPEKFNLELLRNCHDLNFRTDMCPHVANSGLGQPFPTTLESTETNNTSWFATNQFTVEMIFHARLLNHPCRTYDISRATLFYVPYYAGLHVSKNFRERNQTARNELDVALIDYLRSQPAWRKYKGRDHFITLGRVVRDFTSSWAGAGSFLNLDGVGNMSVLIIERNPKANNNNDNNQHGIPYPSYFHPSTLHEISTWQETIRHSPRPYLFSFIGAKRRKSTLRNEFMRQCNESTRCMLLNCNDEARKCQEPREVLRVMSGSLFCLQPPGDTYTRRSTFDSMLAGCVPVFFSPHTAYSQYEWYLPENGSEYSVYIDQRSEARKRIEEELMKIPSEKVEMLREKIIGLIPRLNYANPNASEVGFEDAVDIALESLGKKVKKFVD